MALTDAHVWFAYWIGVLLVLDRHHVTTSEVYVGGVLDQPLSLWFAARLWRADQGPRVRARPEQESGVNHRERFQPERNRFEVS